MGQRVILTIMISAPPSEGGCSGPFLQSQYLSACSVIQPSTEAFSASGIRSSGSATPWRILCIVFVIRKTPGFGFGTYLQFLRLEKRHIVGQMGLHSPS